MTTKIRKPHVRLSVENRALLCSMANAGAKNADLAKVFGISSQTAGNIIRAAK